VKSREQFVSELARNAASFFGKKQIFESLYEGDVQHQFEINQFNKFITSIGMNSQVLDLACGNGRFSYQLAQKTNHTLAYDLSCSGLKSARTKCQTSNVTFIKGSMFELPYRDNTFDAIWFSEAFEYVPVDRRENFLRILQRILKSKGFLYISAETWMHPSLKKSLRRFLKDLELFFYWRYLKRKPVLYGEFLYNLSSKNESTDNPTWHYRTHIDKWKLAGLLRKVGFKILSLNLHVIQRWETGYLYVISRKTE